MISSINKTFGCCSKIFGCSNKKIFVVPNFIAVTKPCFPVEVFCHLDDRVIYFRYFIISKGKLALVELTLFLRLPYYLNMGVKESLF